MKQRLYLLVVFTLVACGVDGGAEPLEERQSGSPASSSTPDLSPSAASQDEATGQEPKQPPASENECEHGVDARGVCLPAAADGICSPGETYEQAPSDCPPPDVVFAGGNIDALRATSPDLHFGRLRITGKLTLRPYEHVEIVASEVRVESSGNIDWDYDTCEWPDAPDLTILASGTVILNGYVSLSGRFGKSHTSSASCASCNGTHGGTLTVVATNIAIGASVDVAGGAAGAIKDYYGDTYAAIGCDGGDGGNVVLEATARIDMAGVRMDIRAGSGGPGSDAWSFGEAGANGAMIWLAPSIVTAEMESNALYTSPHDIALSPLTIHGNVSPTDDAELQFGNSAFEITNPSVRDYVEDLYRVRNVDAVGKTYQINLHPAQGGVDLDLYVVTDDIAVYAESTSPSGTESVSVYLEAGETYYIAVSHFSGPSTAYTLTLVEGS